jgi:CDP-glucose 4,6-dehydratase
VTETYKRSFFNKNGVNISTARAGNVIGGGDFAQDRIIPDCVRAVKKDEPILIRNPYSIRPYQHVLEALGAYLLILQAQSEQPQKAGCYNVGPNDGDCVSTGDLVDMFCAAWGENARWENKSEPNAPHEAGFLKLDCSKVKAVLNWQPKWDIKEAVNQTVAWEKARFSGADIREITDRQIRNYLI